MHDFLELFLAIIFSIIVGIGGWYVWRKINYNLSYKDMVQEQIYNSIKPECLRKE